MTTMDVDNPAGRLHGMLRDFQSVAAGTSHTCARVWSEVLGIAPGSAEFGARIGAIAALFGETLDHLTQAGHVALAANLSTTSPTVLRALDIGNPGFHTQGEARSAVDDSAQSHLYALATVLHQTLPDGRVPDPDEVDDLTSRLTSLIDELGADADIPAEVRRLLIRRLGDVLQAVQQLRVGGPEAVRNACTLLAVALAETAAAAASSKVTFRKVVEVAGLTAALCASLTVITSTVDHSVKSLSPVIQYVQEITGTLLEEDVPAEGADEIQDAVVVED